MECNKNISTCCNRKRSKQDLLYLPIAVMFTVFGFISLLAIEMGIAYALGFV